MTASRLRTTPRKFQRGVVMGVLGIGWALCSAEDATALAQIDQYNVVWTSQSRNAGESMPCSGGDIGLNVWVEKDELFVYLGQAGCRDENGALLKPGRVRIKLTPNPFANGTFRQELNLREGYVSVGGAWPDGSPLTIKVWIEVARPMVHLDIHAARLGDAELAKKLNTQKMGNGPYRFPAFWPHTIDWAPDHNWGGSGMIGLQEMVLQTHALPGEGGKIRVLPAWPKDWDVDFKLHAPYKTTVEVTFESGKVTSLKVTPKDRQNDVVLTGEDR